MAIFVLLTTVVLATLAQTDEKSPPKVAVIGGGIGGTSVAYFLSQRLPGADVTVFEMGRVGGRLDTVDIAGRRYEVGGSIIHSSNLLMVQVLLHGLPQSLHHLNHLHHLPSCWRCAGCRGNRGRGTRVGATGRFHSTGSGPVHYSAKKTP